MVVHQMAELQEVSSSNKDCIIVPSNQILLDSLDSSVFVIGLVTFVGDAARGILFPALWPLCQALGGTKFEYGFLVSIFSFGRLLTTTRLGIISDIHRHRFSLIIAGIVLTIGALLWSNVKFMDTLSVLYLAQLVMGMGTGSLGVTRSYIVEQVAPSRRTNMLACLSALQYAGFAATPLLGSALVIGGAAISTDWQFVLPGYLVLLLALLCLWLLIYKFEDIKAMYVHNAQSITSNSKSGIADGNCIELMEQGVHNPIATANAGSTTADTTTEEDEPQSANTAPAINVSAPACTNKTIALVTINNTNEQNDRLKYSVYLLMMFLNFTTRGGITVYETQGSQLLLDKYNVPQWELGLLVSIAGLIGTVQLVYFKQFWTAHFSDITLMIGGLILFAVAQLLVIQWATDKVISMGQYVLSMFLVYAFAYPISNSAVLGVFSSLQKDGKQSKALGRFAFMGSLARVVLSIITGYLESSASFAIVLILMSLSLIGVALLYNEIVFYSSATLPDNAVFDAKDPKHKISVLNIVLIGTSAVAALVALLAAVNFGNVHD